MGLRQRKTRDVWYFYVNYGHGWEHELTEDSRAAAIAQRKTYAENCPQYPTRIVKRRERIVLPGNSQPNGLPTC